MLPKDPEEHRCPMCGNLVGQPQDSPEHHSLREGLGVLDEVIAQLKEMNRLLGETLQLMRKEHP